MSSFEFVFCSETKCNVYSSTSGAKFLIVRSKFHQQFGLPGRGAGGSWTAGLVEKLALLRYLGNGRTAFNYVGNERKEQVRLSFCRTFPLGRSKLPAVLPP